MPCNECPDSLEVNPNDGCLDPITSDCITYTGPAIPCLTITTGSSLETVIDLLSDAICTLQDEQFTWNCNLLSTCSINSLSDVVTTTPEVGQYLTWNGSNWVNTTLTIPDTFECSDLNSCDISALGNVSASSPNAGDVLTWNSEVNQWVAQSFQCSNLSGCNLDAFGDVNVPTPAEGEVLTWDSTNSEWIAAGVPSIELYTSNNGITETANNFKLGGTLVENTTIDSASYDFTFNNVAKLGIFSGSATFAPKTYFQSAHNVSNPTNTLGCQTNILETNATLSSYSLTNGKAFINSLFKNTFSIGSNITIQDGSQISNSFSYQSFNATGSSRNFTVDQSSGLRVLGNNKIATELSFSDYLTTINHYANFEIINNVANASNINTFTNFYQLLIRKSYGTGSLLATSSNLVNTYGIYQEGTADKNVFYGEIEYHGALTNASDLRSKNKGEAFTKGLDVIEQINPTHFTKKEGFGATDVNHVGIIAQELESILPEAIKIGKCQDIEDFRFYDQSVLVYTLLNAVKELSEKVKQLEAK